MTCPTNTCPHPHYPPSMSDVPHYQKTNGEWRCTECPDWGKDTHPGLSIQIERMRARLERADALAVAVGALKQSPSNLVREALRAYEEAER